jgi:hypothetical protein
MAAGCTHKRGCRRPRRSADALTQDYLWDRWDLVGRRLIDPRFRPLLLEPAASLVIGEALEELGDLLRLLLDQLLELCGSAAAVVGLDAGAAAVVAGSAGGDEVRKAPRTTRAAASSGLCDARSSRSPGSEARRSCIGDRRGRARPCEAVAIAPSSSVGRSFRHSRR